jgi:hypothetical protein
MIRCPFAILTFLPLLAVADDSLRILPEQIALSNTAARQRLVVERFQDGEAVGAVTEGVTFQSGNPNVVRIEEGIALPGGNGTATITASVNGQTAKAQVKVTGQETLHTWSFRNQVQSVLSKQGCNSGACHGAAAGKNGFKLSLRGYDPEFDYYSITRQSQGRRIVPKDPGRSLLLTKPTGAIPHKGGVRFREDSRDYRVISEWIASGQKGPEAEDPRLDYLEILPQNATLKPGDTQPLIVLAHFTDATVEDVTAWAKYTPTNLTVAKVDEGGTVNVAGHGEGSIVAWYLAKNVVATVTAPYPNEVPKNVFADAPKSNLIDELVLAKLEQLNLPPSPRCSDGEFLRRAYLDTMGVLPTVEETKAFLADASADKRARLVDELLKRPEFVDYWAYKWSDLLLLSGQRLRPEALDAFYKWIRQNVEANTPWDQFVRDIVLAKGGTFENGAANFYSLHQDPLEMSENVSMAFLGMSIGCAKCHDHPLEKWTNDQYYGMANLFARVKGKGWGGDYRSGDGKRTIFITEEGDLIQPRTGKPQPPTPLDGEALPFDDTTDRREHLAQWLTSPENPYFSRAIVNRVWANYLGVGIVEAVDDVRLTNPPSNEALLAALSQSLVEQKFDLKALMRLILTSETYQRSSEPLEANRPDERYYSRYFPKRLSAEVLLDAISQVAEAPTKFPGYPDGTRALELRDAAVDSYFLQTFGRPDRLITCECERTSDPSMTQVLHILNGDTLNEKLSRKADEKAKTTDNRIGRLLQANADTGAILDEIYLAAFSRLPSPEDRTRLLNVLSSVPEAEQRESLEDLAWSLLSSKEFLFNH